MSFHRNAGDFAARRLAGASVLLGIALLGLALAACGSGSGSVSGSTPPSFVLVSLDATRADHLGAYGYDRDTTPFIDSLARRGFLFEQAVAPSLNTLVSHASLLTGLPAWAHGATWRGGGRALHPAFTSLAEDFAERGYETGAFAAHGDWLSSEMGMAQGFDTFSTGYRPAEEVLGEAMEWLTGLPDRAPFLLFVHLYDAHSDYAGRPYEAPEPFLGTWAGPEWGEELGGSDYLAAVNDGEMEMTPELAERLASQYDEGLAYMDHRLRLFWESAAAERLAQSWIVIVSDHGEAFFEHGKMMHVTLHDEVALVPFIVVPPSGGELTPRAPARISRQVRLVDVRPTLLSLAGLPEPEDSLGVDLSPCLRAPDDGRSCPSRPATLYRGGLRHDGHKLIKTPTGSLLYDLRRDPGEMENLAGRPDTWRRQRGMQRLLTRLVAEERALRERVVAGADLEPPERNREAEERLRALGYVD